MSKLKAFTWVPLRSSTSIRVFTLEDSPKFGSIRCSMSEIELNDNPVYRALSYCWELDPYPLWRPPRSRKHTLICNGESLAVEENLYLAIRYFASLHDRTPVWSDAICIHQGSAEVSSQIQLMGRIYRSARDVVVWLGKPNTWSARGMRWIEANCSETSNESLFDTSANPKHLLRVDMDEYLEAFSTNGKSKEALTKHLHNALGEASASDIFTLRWFTRAWVLQEAILAKNLSFVLGDCAVSDVAMYNGLRYALQYARRDWIKSQRKSFLFEDHTTSKLLHLHSIRIMFEMRFSQKCGSNPVHLLSCVLLGWNRRAKKTKDKVFGVLGFMDLTDIENSASTGRLPRQSLHFDYDADDRSTFVACTRAILEEEGNLAALSLSQGVAPSAIPSTAFKLTDTSKRWHRFSGQSPLQCGVDNLPTWAIDFTRMLQPRPLIFSYNHSFNASPGVQRSPAFVQNNSILCLEGILWDEIQLLGEDSSIFQPLGYQYFSGDILRILSRIGAQYKPTNETTLRAFARTVTVNHPDCFQDAQKTFLRKWGGMDFLGWLVDTIQAAFGTPRFLGESMLKRNPIDPEQKSKFGNDRKQSAKDRIAYLKESWDKFLQNVDVDGHVNDTLHSAHYVRQCTSFSIIFTYMYEHRRLFLTEKGYLGVAARSIQPGDIVAVLPGARVPFALRKADPQSDESAWRLVGEAYVHGIMAGEATSGEMQKITIC